MKIRLAVAVAVGLAVPAMGQNMGVSHPEQVPITTSPDGIQQSVVYEAPPAKPSATQPMVPAPPAEAKPTMSAEVATPRVKQDETITTLTTRPDFDEGVVTRVAGPANQLPVGTLVKVTMKQEISTKATAAGTVFTAELVAPVLRDGKVLLPAGSTLTGHVTEIHGGRRISGQASMHLMTQQVALPDGTVYPVKAQVIDTDLYRAMKVDEEGTLIRRDHKAGTLATISLSTGSGAAAGAMFGGWPGAIVGAAVAAGVSTAVWLKQDRQTALPAGTGVTFMLTGPVVVGTP